MARLGVRNPLYKVWVAAIVELAAQRNLWVNMTGAGAINSQRTVEMLVAAGVPPEQIIAVAMLVKA